ncbi:MAG TPA: mechanosensitive ion channel domain-containing protein [Methylomirabilota bacterium]|nr:mechanosensitive ion channel domain-containing protein [Methylomirabilota bacterium]
MAPQAEAVNRLLRDFDMLLGPSVTIKMIEKRLPDLGARIEAQGAVTDRQLEGEPVGDVLDGLTAQWQATRAELADFVETLAERVRGLERALARFDALREAWRQGRVDAQASRAPAQVIERIDGVLSSIGAARSSLEKQRSAILVLQDRVAQEAARCDRMLARIAATRQAAAGGLTDRDRVSLWDGAERARATSELPGRIRLAFTAGLDQLRQFARDQRWQIPLHVALFVGLVLLTRAARRRAQLWISSDDVAAAGTRGLERPVSAALLLALLAAPWIYAPPIPRAVGSLSLMLAAVPAIRIVRLLVGPPLARGLYVVGALFLFDLVRRVSSVVPLVEQQVFLLEMLAAMAVLAAWPLARRRGWAPALPGRETQATLLRFAGGTLLVLFAVAFVAGAGGYMRLGLLLGAGVLGNGYLAMVLVAVVNVGDGLVALALRTRALGHLGMVQHHRPRLERRARRGLRWLGFAIWMYLALRYFGLWTAAVAFGERALATELRGGALTVSLGDVLAFVVTVGAAFVLSSLIHFVLAEDVYPRLNLGRGVSNALSSLLHYALLLVGFLLALAVLGVDFTKVTILMGAFGVGIGFGLQGIVNNFVSGLVVLFERRIEVGDVVQVGQVEGRLAGLGVRACTVRTWEGAEVIVPNASLVSENVTNWTLSDRSRRVDVPVGVAYGTAPEKVIELMLRVARAHSLVRSQPEPMALFLGFGESELRFELRVWVPFDRWVQIRSELSVDLYAALGEAGIEIPFPQREVRLRPG